MTQPVPPCRQCPLPSRRTVGRNTRLCETHYQEWYDARCRETVVTYQGTANYAYRCERAAKVEGYCTQHYKMKAKRLGITP